MNVLFILHTTNMAGSSLSFLNLVKGLKERGVIVMAVGPRQDYGLVDRLKKIGIHYYGISVAESVYPSRGVLFLFKCINLLRRKYLSYKDILNITRSFSPDIIHTNVGTIHEGYKVSKTLGIPHVWHLREYQDKDFGWRCFPCKSSFISKLKKSFVITISQDIRNYFKLQDYDRAKTIYNGIFEKINLPFSPQKEKFFLCCSRVSREKGHESVIQAFSVFQKKHSDYKLKVLGDGNKDYIKYLKNMSIDYGCSNSIEWLGYQKDVLPYMKKATALIVASRFEGFGRMTAEACFAGCLVIGRKSGGTREILEETGGFLFDDNDGLVSSMQRVCHLSPEQYLEKALFAQQKAQELYSIDNNVGKIYDFYKKILSIN